MSWGIRHFVIGVILFILSFVGIGAYAQTDNTDNPLTVENNAGGATYIGVPGAEGGDNNTGGRGDALLNVIKSVINRTLGILGLVALIIVLYAGFLMLFSFGDDERFNKGRKILKYAAIALLVIGLAWFIVNLIFWFIGKVTGVGDGGDGVGQVVNDCNLFQPDPDGNCFGYTEGVDLANTGEQVGNGLIDVIKSIINRVLGILGLIALIIVIYGGLLMLFSLGEEDKYKKGWTIMKYAAIGLIIIGVAWFIVSIVFWLVTKVVP